MWLRAEEAELLARPWVCMRLLDRAAGHSARLMVSKFHQLAVAAALVSTLHPKGEVQVLEGKSAHTLLHVGAAPR